MSQRLVQQHLKNESREQMYSSPESGEAEEEDENVSDVPLNLVATSLSEDAH